MTPLSQRIEDQGVRASHGPLALISEDPVQGKGEPKMKTSLCAVLIVLLVLVTGSIASTDDLANLRMYPTEVSLALGRTQQFWVFGTDAQGNVVPVESPTTWSLSNPTAGIVNSDGVLTATNTTPQTGISALPDGMTYPVTTSLSQP